MKKKLLSIQNMRAMALEQSLRKQNGQNKVEIIISDYRQKLEKLLQKLTVQTKYTNRVSQCNLRNMQELEHVKKQLHHLLQLRKMQEKNDIMLKNLNHQLSSALTQTQQKLIISANQVFQLKKQVKKYKKEMIEQKKEIQKLQLQLRKSERQKYHSMVELYDREDNKLISTLVEDYIKEIKHPSSIVLYKHCIQTLRNKTFNNFLKGLQVKRNSLEIQNKDTLRLKQAQQLKSVETRRKLSNLSLMNQASTIQSKTKSKNMQGSFKLPSFHMKTQGSYSQPKYSVF